MPVDEFLGTHTPRLDDKGRLFLPARFRGALAAGLVVTTGQEGCLYVFPTAEFHRISGLMQAAPGSSRQVRDFVRVFRASAHPDTPDRQGRVTIPAALRAYARPRQGVHGHRQRQPARALGLGRVVGLPRRGHARLLLLLGPLGGGGPGPVRPAALPHPACAAPRRQDATHADLQTHRRPTRPPASSRPVSRRDFPRAGRGSDGDPLPGRPAPDSRSGDPDPGRPRPPTARHQPLTEGGPR